MAIINDTMKQFNKISKWINPNFRWTFFFYLHALDFANHKFIIIK